MGGNDEGFFQISDRKYPKKNFEKFRMNFFAFMVPGEKKLFSFFRGLGQLFVYTRVDIVCNKRFNVFWFQKTYKNLHNLHFEFDVTLIYISL